MKKIPIFIVFLLLTLTLSSCFENEPVGEYTKEELQILSQINESLSSYDFQSANGFDYSSKQYIDESVVNGLVIEQRIEHGEDIKIYSQYETITLSEFNTDSQFGLSETIDFYYIDQKGTYDSDDLMWSDMTLDEYLDFTLPINEIDFTMFVEFNISNVNEIKIEATVDSSYYHSILGVEDTTISSLTITIAIEKDTSNLLSISINYQQNNSNTEIMFEPFYQDAQVIIPQ